MIIIFKGVATALNYYSVNWLIRVQNVLTVTKLGAILLLDFACGIYQIFYLGNTEHLKSGFQGSEATWRITFLRRMVLFLILICRHVKLNFPIEPALRCFLNCVTEELKNPYVNLPRAIIIGCSVVTLFYVAVNVAYLTALSPQSIIQSSAVAVDAANYLLGPPIAFIIPITVACSTFRRVSFWFIHNWQVHSFNFNSTSSI